MCIPHWTLQSGQNHTVQTTIYSNTWERWRLAACPCSGTQRFFLSSYVEILEQGSSVEQSRDSGQQHDTDLDSSHCAAAAASRNESLLKKKKNSPSPKSTEKMYNLIFLLPLLRLICNVTISCFFFKCAVFN